MKNILFIISFLILSCTINDDQVEYDEQLVLWANLRANLPLIDTVFVTRSANLKENVSSKQLWIDDAQVHIIGDTIDLLLNPVFNSPGRYFTNSNYIFQGGEIYQVLAIHGIDTISGMTVIPGKMEISATPESIYSCKGTTFNVPEININNYDPTIWPPITGHIDTLTLKQGECFTESFASYPLFKIDFNEQDYETIRILSLALDADSVNLDHDVWRDFCDAVDGVTSWNLPICCTFRDWSDHLAAVYSSCGHELCRGDSGRPVSRGSTS